MYVKRLICFIAFTLLAFAWCSGAAQVDNPDLPENDLPYVQQSRFISPGSGEEFFAFVLRSPVAAVSYDLDGCPHPPLNTFAYALVIDPSSGWVDTPEAFALADPNKVKRLTGTLPAPRFNRDAPAGLPWAGAYPWEKYENAARLSEANRSSQLSQGRWWLNAAWSVRLDVISGANLYDREVEELFSRLPAPEATAADLFASRELLIARQIEELAARGRLTNMSQAQAALARAWLYRGRGELAAVRASLAECENADNTLSGPGSLFDYLNSSSQLEEEYIRSALPHLEAAFNNGDAAQPQVGSVAFTIGELHRRLGQLDQAQLWFGQAAKYPAGTNSTLIQRQSSLSQGRGY